MEQSFGPIILDVAGVELTAEDREILQHPLVSGVILFARNYVDRKQVTELCKTIRAARKAPLLITVDQEGGRVQRFREGFTRLPSMGNLGELYQDQAEVAIKTAEATGWLMAAELLEIGVDLSFAPVLDLDKQICPAIGNRAFHRDTDIVVTLATAVMKGMNTAGMIATGKHFPGHGSVDVDSHKEIPVDHREMDEISNDDMQTFIKLIKNGICAMMPAHIIFPKVDKNPVGFSNVWLQDILRKQLQFKGIVFSDDMNMEGASFAGDYTARGVKALEAGCDIVLICNNRVGAAQMLDNLPRHYKLDTEKFKLLQGQFVYDQDQLRKSKMWLEKSEYVNRRYSDEYAR